MKPLIGFAVNIFWQKCMWVRCGHQATCTGKLFYFISEVKFVYFSSSEISCNMNIYLGNYLDVKLNLFADNVCGSAVGTKRHVQVYAAALFHYCAQICLF